eukprot:Rhum_TRINITY_DN13104_c0_g1::Rhum_TRINITY_DN13104_c0_g1_i3::g.57062::m.57062
MRVIVVVDDFGVNAARSRGTIEALRKGFVQSVSLLVNGACPEEMLREAVRDVPSFTPSQVGLHLNVTEGPSLTGVSTLTDADARFVGKVALRERVAAGTVAAADVAAEATAQAAAAERMVRAAFCDANAVVTHFDGHNHAHTQPGLLAPLAATLCALGYKTVRIPRDAEYAAAFGCGGLAEEAEVLAAGIAGATCQPAFHALVTAEAVHARRVYCDEHGLQTTAQFCGLKPLEGCSKEALRRMFDAVDRGCGGGGVDAADAAVEVMTHMGHTLREPVESGVAYHSDFFSVSEDREVELATWASGDVARILEAYTPADFASLWTAPHPQHAPARR